MPRPFVSSNAPTSSSASPNAMRFVSFRSSVCAYASLALRALGVLGLSETHGLRGFEEKLYAPPATTSLLRAIVGYGESFDYLRWRRGGQPVEVLLDFFSELLSITTYDTGKTTSSRGIKVGKSNDRPSLLFLSRSIRAANTLLAPTVRCSLSWCSGGVL